MLSAKRLSKVFKDSNNNDIYAVKDVSLEIRDGEFIVVYGRPGAGKTALINVLSGLHTPTTGVVEYNNVNISALEDRSFMNFRKKNIGVILQHYYLVQTMTVYENIEMIAKLVGMSKGPVYEMIEKVGLRGKENEYPSRLSRDEQQRLAVARALIKNPRILFCDEPTGSLNKEAGHRILNLINDLTPHMAVFAVTHKQNDPVLNSLANRIFIMENGELYA